MIQNNTGNSPNFGAGLNQNIYRKIKNTNIQEVENSFKKMGVNAKFNGSQTYAATTSFVAEIMDEASKKYNLPFEYRPSAIYIYKQKELNVEQSYFAAGFLTNDAETVIKGKPIFPANSLFLHKNISDSPILLDLTSSGEYYIANNASTPHFLHETIHEWIHNIHFNRLCEQFGFDGKCTIFKEKYPMKKLPSDSIFDTFYDLRLPKGCKKYCLKNFGEYSCFKDYTSEFFAEAMTQFVVKSLDKNLRVVKNPLDNIQKDMPDKLKEFIDITLFK